MSHSGVMPMTQARSRNFHRFYDINGWCFVLASLTLVLLFMIYPILNSLWLSLHSGKGVIVQFVGFGNITRLMNDQVFITALTNTLIFLIVQVPLMILLSLATASCLNSPNVRFRSFFRMAIFLPCVTSLVAYSILFKSMFGYDGIVNSALMTIGLIEHPIA